MKLIHICIMCLAAMAPAVYADIVDYSVSVNTQPLVGSVAGPFSLSFQLADGSGIGDGNNAAILSGFQLNGGAPAGSPFLLGSAFGDLASTVTLTDAAFPTLFVQGFTPGSRLDFQLSVTTNLDPVIPDAFLFSILDNTLHPLPTTSGFDAFLEIDIDSVNPMVTTDASDLSRSPVAGGPALDLGTPSVERVAAVPEPTTVVLLGTMLAVAGLLYRKRGN